MSFGTRAAGVLTATANFTSNDTVLFGAVTYKFEASPAAANDIDVGTDLEASLVNLAGAINGNFAVGEAHADTVAIDGVSAVSTATLLTVTADMPGLFGNFIDFREGVDGGAVFSISTAMAGGLGDLAAEVGVIVTEEQMNSLVIARLAELVPTVTI